MMSDFLRPLDSNPFSAAYQQAMGSSGYLGAAAANSMSQYYASNFGHATSMTSQFAASGMGYHHPHHHHPGGLGAGPGGSPFSFGSAATHMSSMPSSLVAGAMA